MSTYLCALIHFVPKCAHFSCTYVLTIFQDLGTDIYANDAKSDEN